MMTKKRYNAATYNSTVFTRCVNRLVRKFKSITADKEKLLIGVLFICFAVFFYCLLRFNIGTPHAKMMPRIYQDAKTAAITQCIDNITNHYYTQAPDLQKVCIETYDVVYSVYEVHGDE